MSTVLSQKEGIKARKTHQCVFCQELINAGELYDKRNGVDGGDMWTMKMHPECHAYERKVGVDSDWYECVYDPAFARKVAIEATAIPGVVCTNGSVDLLTNRKTESIIADRNYQITGYVLTSKSGKESCVVDRCAVRWLTSAEWWELMHPASDDPAAS